MSVAVGQHHLLLQVLLYEPQRPGGGVIILTWCTNIYMHVSKIQACYKIYIDQPQASKINEHAHAYTVTYFPEAVKSA